MLVAGLALAALVAVTTLLLRHCSQQSATHERDRDRWATERRQLLDRIQRPDLLPTTPVEFVVPEQEPDEWALVGTIASSDGAEAEAE